jgi:hypothetical protein
MVDLDKIAFQNLTFKQLLNDLQPELLQEGFEYLTEPYRMKHEGDWILIKDSYNLIGVAKKKYEGYEGKAKTYYEITRDYEHADLRFLIRFRLNRITPKSGALEALKNEIQPLIKGFNFKLISSNHAYIVELNEMFDASDPAIKEKVKQGLLHLDHIVGDNLRKILDPTYQAKNLRLEEDIEAETEDTSGNVTASKPFDPTKINIETKTPSIDTLLKRIERKTVQLNTESYFQRKSDLWDETKQSRLIESILLRFPLPAFFFDASDDKNWLVVDGLQRLSSFRNFCVTKTLKLKNLEFLIDLNGSAWDDLGDDLQRVMEETQVVIYKIMPGTPTDVKFNIFKRINTGGLMLEPQEIRHALFQGKPAQFIAELARVNAFLEVTDHKIKTHRMLDRDFANRFLAFYLFGYEPNEPDLDTFMSKAMASISNKTEEECAKIKKDFALAMELAQTIFGKKAFRRSTGDHTRLLPLNKALFEVIAVRFALLTPDVRAKLQAHKTVFQTKLARLQEDDKKFVTAITTSTGDKNRILYRHNAIKKLIIETVNEVTNH